MQIAPLFIEVSVSRHESERTHIGINVRDSRMANQEWIIQRHWQHCVHTTHDGDKKNTKQKKHRKLKRCLSCRVSLYFRFEFCFILTMWYFILLYIGYTRTQILSYTCTQILSYTRTQILRPP